MISQNKRGNIKEINTGSGLFSFESIATHVAGSGVYISSKGEKK